MSKEASIKHPFSKEKLKVFDQFSAPASLACKNCSARPDVLLVESNNTRVRHYAVVSCAPCGTQQWRIIFNKT